MGACADLSWPEKVLQWPFCRERTRGGNRSFPQKASSPQYGPSLPLQHIILFYYILLKDIEYVIYTPYIICVCYIYIFIMKKNMVVYAVNTCSLSILYMIVCIC